MSLMNEKITVAAVKAEIEATTETARLRLRHLRALQRVLEDEARGQQPLFPALEQEAQADQEPGKAPAEAAPSATKPKRSHSKVEE
jgi:hypothetical protein